ncbi:MAG: hypothetical protein ACXVPD_16240, partial [Bacteroidia bacterium]
MKILSVIFLVAFAALTAHAFRLPSGSILIQIDSTTPAAAASVPNASNESFSWKVKLLAFLAFVIALALFAVYLRRNKTFRNDLTNSSKSGFISLKMARLLLFVGSVIIPVAAISYAVLHNE